jgi:hypothetical protein
MFVYEWYSPLQNFLGRLSYLCRFDKSEVPVKVGASRSGFVFAAAMPHDIVFELAAPKLNHVPAFAETLVHVWLRRGNDCEHSGLFI